jgi:hypothetical protein
MNVHCSLVAGILFVCLVGCRTPFAERSDLQLGLRDSPELKEAIANAVDCPEQLQDKGAICPPPAFAMHKVDINFKYGRFCGRDYPKLPKQFNKKNENGLSYSERLDLARVYFRIRPIDDIDKICQAHDVCWIVNGKPLLECNDVFNDQLKALREKYRKQIWSGGSSDTNLRLERCRNLALDMSAASDLFEGDSDDTGYKLSRFIGRFISAPFEFLYIVMFYAGSAIDLYPHATDRCVLAPQSN